MGNLLSDIWSGLQQSLFPVLEQECGPLTETDQRFVQVLAVLGERFGALLVPYGYGGVGRRPDPRGPLARAFIAKSVYRLSTHIGLIEALQTQRFLRRTCGWDSPGEVPGEWTFSRAFAEFAQGQLPQALHAALIETHLKAHLLGHISRDSTAIAARETVRETPAAATVPAKHKRGRPRKGEVRAARPLKRLELQPQRSLTENLVELPRHCAWGCRRTTRGQNEFWKGYKLHLDVVDGEIPVSAVLTSASLHDSQVAIPLAQLSASRITVLYELMDSAYDATPSKQFCQQLGHVPIIEPNPQRLNAVPLAPAEAARMKQRTASERVHSQLKDNYGGRQIRVRGPTKVMCQLMFGLVALTAIQLLQRVL